MKRTLALPVAAGLVALALGGGTASMIPAVAATPPPTPPPIGAPATPTAAPTFTPAPMATYSFPITPTPTPGPSGHATPTPPPNARKGIEGVWEVEIQHPNVTDYTHLKLTQNGDTLTGTYLNSAGKKFPLVGSVQGAAVRLIVSLADGTTLLLEGRLDGTTDMIGMLTGPQGQVPFTAAYRPKEKWIENINPAPGGMGGAPGGGGYTPPR